MSHVSESVSGHIILADYVNVDAAGKVNIIGGGLQFLGFDPETGMSSPFAVFATLTARLKPAEDSRAAMEILLVDLDNKPVELPGPAGLQAMRIAQNMDFRAHPAPGSQVQPPGFPSQNNVALNFPGGLPLPLGRTYEWIVQLDHELIARTTFHIPGLPEQVVIG